MTKLEFKTRWESDDIGGGINFDDVAKCAIAWGITDRPRTRPMDRILYLVLVSAGVTDAEDYNPNKMEDEDVYEDKYAY